MSVLAEHSTAIEGEVASPRKPRSRTPATGTFAISAGTLLALVLGWVIATRYHLASPLFLPSPSEVLVQFQAIASDGYANGTLTEHILASLGRISVSLAFGIVLGVPIGLIMGLNRWAKGVLSVPIDIYWGLPPLAYLPLLIIWLGIGESSKILLLSLSAFAPICYAAQAGVRSVPQERINAAQSLGANTFQLFTTIVLPSALPEILTGLRIAIGATLSTLVAAELIAAQSGVGYMIMSAANFLATDVVFVGLIVIAIFAFAFTAAMRFLEKQLVPWKGKL
ncbi:ABC transporter permease subunit [Rhizobium sp. BE258]|jgi:taurine transport system permease protein|uniref:ABC transporter permease subunit n=1 Tax=unclassified Rhizobium TaxID=2613769 RepID=UPI000DD96BAC|nr:ABC transporter permease subunit [Rhizobium sp. BE258]MDR7142572.1 taurine transport system permease protein [Rhizobium sp. BE258]